MLKSIVEKEIGIKFDLRTCRRTYAQMAIDEDLDVESVSVLMGHDTTKTTETYYCRKRPETAIRDARNIWMARRATQMRKTLKLNLKMR